MTSTSRTLAGHVSATLPARELQCAKLRPGCIISSVLCILRGTYIGLGACSEKWRPSRKHGASRIRVVFLPGGFFVDSGSHVQDGDSVAELSAIGSAGRLALADGRHFRDVPHCGHTQSGGGESEENPPQSRHSYRGFPTDVRLPRAGEAVPPEAGCFALSGLGRII